MAHLEFGGKSISLITPMEVAGLFLWQVTPQVVNEKIMVVIATRTLLLIIKTLGTD